jgi:hypothetical protein
MNTFSNEMKTFSNEMKTFSNEMKSISNGMKSIRNVTGFIPLVMESIRYVKFSALLPKKTSSAE